MKKIIPFFICVCLLLSSFTVLTAANGYVSVTTGSEATVIEVVDGDAIIVRLINGSLALVRLLGIDTSSSNEALNWLSNELLGFKVTVSTDPSFNNANQRWSKLYVYKSGELTNAKMLKNGIAKMNSDAVKCNLLRTLSESESFARTAKLGVWNEVNSSGTVVNSDRININTANVQTLRELLGDTSTTMASRIASYRSTNPYSSVSDIKFVNGMTKDIYDKIRNQITVVTDINNASEKELLSLSQITEEQVLKIIEYRTKYTIQDFFELYENEIISFAVYSANRNYISIDGTSVPMVTIPNYAVNINTASRDRLILAGLTAAQADRIIAAREVYPIKSLYELPNISGINLSEANINALSDNLKTMTNIDEATEYEIRSLLNASASAADITSIMKNRPFWSLATLKLYISVNAYNKISPFVYAGQYETNYVNLNTATQTQLRELGYTNTQAAAIYNLRGRMTKPSDIPSEASAYLDKVTLITNINAASPTELATLGTFMSQSVIGDIIAYRADQPFGSKAEIETFFSQKNLLANYRSIEKFISVR